VAGPVLGIIHHRVGSASRKNPVAVDIFPRLYQWHLTMISCFPQTLLCALPAAVVFQRRRP